MSIDEKIKALGLCLPKAPERAGVYMPVKICGEMAYLSGVGPNTANETFAGKIGRELSPEDGRRAAESCMRNILAIMKRDLGSLDKITRFVKMTVFVASADDFYQQPFVANAATEMLVSIFGEEIGCPARSAVGVNVLPGNIPVEIEICLCTESL